MGNYFNFQPKHPSSLKIFSFANGLRLMAHCNVRAADVLGGKYPTFFSKNTRGGKLCFAQESVATLAG